MLEAAAARIGPHLVNAHVGLLQDELPAGDFDLVVSALAIHHLEGPEKAELFRRLRAVVAPGGRFVLGDVIVPEDASAGAIELTHGYDKPSPSRTSCGGLARPGSNRSRSFGSVTTSR